MLRPRCYITITKEDGRFLEFDFCNQFETNESYEFLTSTASVILPRKLTQNNLELFTGANPVFKRKDKIKIEAGYFPNRQVLFEGFISHVSANIPVRLECEDNMFVFKQYRVTYPKTRQVQTLSKKGKPLKHPKITSANIKLSELIGNIWHEGEYNDLLDDYTFKIVDEIPLGQFRATNATPTQIFDKLKDVYGIYCYMVGTVLNVGFASNALDSKTAEFVMEDVCINSETMNYQREEDVNIRVKAVSMLPNNNRIETEVGDTEGEQRTYHFYNIPTESELKKVATARLNESKYTGFTGDFETFGEPKMRHGDIAKIVSKKLPERNGSYLIRGVRRRFGVDSGYRQVFDLGQKVG